MSDFREWLSDNLRYILLGLFIILALVAIFLGIKLVSSKLSSGNTKEAVNQDKPEDADSKDNQKNKEVEATPTAEPEKKNPLEKNAYPEVNTIIQKYYTALGQKDIEGIKAVVDELNITEEAKITRDQYLDGYSNVEVYSKKGLEDGSYIVFARYNYKFKGVDALVPGLSQLYVCTKEDGSVYISIKEQDAQTQSYISETVQDADVQELVNDVEEQYSAVQEQDAELKAFIGSLGIADSAAAQAQDGETITVKSNCNIRAQANGDAEVIDELEAGEQVTKIGSEGEWIQIEYEGQTGFVRSDLFE